MVIKVCNKVSVIGVIEIFLISKVPLHCMIALFIHQNFTSILLHECRTAVTYIYLKRSFVLYLCLCKSNHFISLLYWRDNTYNLWLTIRMSQICHSNGIIRYQSSIPYVNNEQNGILLYYSICSIFLAVSALLSIFVNFIFYPRYTNTSSNFLAICWIFVVYLCASFLRHAPGTHCHHS